VNVQKLKLWDDASEFDEEKDKACFRQYEDACDRVKNFYKEQHGKKLCLIICGFISFSFAWRLTEKQTVAFNIQARVNFKSRRRARMGIWQAMEMLNTLVDESDPDVSSHVIPPTFLDTATDTTSSVDELVAD
jgi:inositol oxygenase